MRKVYDIADGVYQIGKTLLSYAGGRGAVLILFLILLIASIRSSGAYFYQHSDRGLLFSTGRWPPAGGGPGTSIDASKSASGYWELQSVYDWSVAVDTDAAEVVIPDGESTAIPYRLHAALEPPVTEERIGAIGEICVTNTGDETTADLRILDLIQYKLRGQSFSDLTESQVDTTSKPTLHPGESHCYAYEIEFVPDPDATTFRNVAKVTISNHSGWLPGGNLCPGPDPCPFGPQPKASIDLPRTPVESSTDGSARLSLLIACPAGFTCSSSHPDGVDLQGAADLEFSIEITNQAALRGEYPLSVMAIIIEADTGEERSTLHDLTLVVE